MPHVRIFASKDCRQIDRQGTCLSRLGPAEPHQKARTDPHILLLRHHFGHTTDGWLLVGHNQHLGNHSHLSEYISRAGRLRFQRRLFTWCLALPVSGIRPVDMVFMLQRETTLSLVACHQSSSSLCQYCQRNIDYFCFGIQRGVRYYIFELLKFICLSMRRYAFVTQVIYLDAIGVSRPNL